MATITVTSLDDNTTSGDGFITLREAIQAANTNVSVDGSVAGDSGADIIEFDSGLTGTLTLNGTELSISEDLTLSGPGATNLTINADGNSRVINVTEDVLLTVEGLKLTGGQAMSSGGGINSKGDVTLTNSTVEGNLSITDGGGIFSSGAVTLNDSTVEGNLSITNGGGILSSGAVTLTDSTVSGNSSYSNGGGIRSIGAVTLTDSTVSDNSSDEAGGGIYSEGNVTLTDST